MMNPKTRADWFFPHATSELARKNFTGAWTDKGDMPLPGVKVCIFGFYNKRYDCLAEIAEPNWHAYAQRHGYALRTYPGEFSQNPYCPEIFGDKRKFDLYYDIRGLFKVVMFLDIDSLFIDMEQRIEDVFSGNFLWTYGDGGPQSGLWIAGTGEQTEKHLRYAYRRAFIENNVRHGQIEPCGISDQDSMTDLMRIPPFSNTFGNCVSMESIGLAYPDTKNPKPWIVTCRGGSLEEKLTSMNEWKSRVSQSVVPA